MKVYNVEPAEIDIVVTKGDTFDVSFSVDLNGASYTLTGKQLDMMVKKFDGSIIKILSTTGDTPEIVINADAFNIVSDPFTEVGTCKYDIQVKDGEDIFTFQKGKIIVQEEITTPV